MMNRLEKELSKIKEILECPCGCGHVLTVCQSELYDYSVVVGISKSREEIVKNFHKSDGFIINRDMLTVLQKLCNNKKDKRR